MTNWRRRSEQCFGYYNHRCRVVCHSCIGVSVIAAAVVVHQCYNRDENGMAMIMTTAVRMISDRDDDH